jgi:hypothetical protein
VRYARLTISGLAMDQKRAIAALGALAQISRLYDFSLLTGMKCVFDPKSRRDSGAEGADPAGVSAERFQALS